MSSLSLLRKSVDLIENYDDKNKIKNLMTDLITIEYGFPVVGIFELIDKKFTNVIISGHTEYIEKAGALLGTPLSKLEFSIEDDTHIFGKAVASKQYQITKNVSDFMPSLPIKKTLIKKLLNILMRLYNVRELGAFPCFYRDELFTCFVVGSHKSFSEEEITTLTLLSNQLASYLAIANKITNLENTKKEVEQKYQEERDMIGILGHELRTPLSIAKSRLEYVKNKLEKGENEKDFLIKNIDIAYDSIIREARIVETALSTSKVDNNKIQIMITPVDIDEIIKYVVKAYSSEAKRKELNLVYEQSNPKLPKILTDSTKLQEVITNLISNAIKYTNIGKIKVYTEIKNKSLLIHVQDTGIGIPKDQIKNLGRKFYRVEQHINNNQNIVRPGGTGLGLYVTQAYLHALGGKILIQSELNVGSIFTVELPFISAEGKDEEVFELNTKKDQDLFVQLGFKD